MPARTWVDGAEVDCSAQAWAQRRAGFLGAGFRVVLPAGDARSDALGIARAQAREIAERVGAILDELPWTWLATSPAGFDEHTVEVVGGWTHRFRAPFGACSTRVTVLAAPPTGSASADGRPGLTLPWQVNAHSPLTGLPVLSTHEDSSATDWLGQHTSDVATVGVWRSTTGALVRTTAGTPLLRSVHGWHHPTRADGLMPHHLWQRATTLLAAVPSSASHGAAPDELTAVLCVAPDGVLTHLTSLDGHVLQRPRDAYAVLAPA